MENNQLKIKDYSLRFGTLILTFLFITLIIFLAGASPKEVFVALWQGISSADQFARVLSTLAPLLLCACGLVFTFMAGLYNLGIEGQIIMGAIATTFALRIFQDIIPSYLAILLGIIFGIAGGALWGLFAGVLNVYGKVNEIFAGLGLNFVAQGLTLYLVFGPWKRPGVASMSGTEQFKETVWLPTIGNTEASPIALILAVLGLVVTAIVIRGTYFGLQLRAVGQNLRASYVLGIPAYSRILGAFAICGALGGIAGSLQVLAVFHRLIPNISSNLGFLALLIGMLVGNGILWILPVAFFFSALNVGSLQLPLSLQLESSLAGVIQGSLVLFVLLARAFNNIK
ncbi:ABC transporter permease [Phormidium sp. LEGE 05292]|uniref:ABC transporter permease n=1 Tax=[Phormidium] sp. LEGE 05292 TaxID=767427 RepID=UPI0018809615|nr:ABC transporter permease [Phormidium sp. LEGE 05292]MBE9226146.1 ABC transporter permease [Phormidium sp. LEGE 05292]